jgi:hypothetical protein
MADITSYCVAVRHYLVLTEFLSLINRIDILTAEYRHFLEMELPMPKYTLSEKILMRILIRMDSIGQSLGVIY